MSRGRLWSRPADDPVKSLATAGLVAVAASLTVSATALALLPIQEAHAARELALRMAALLDAAPGLRDVVAEAGVTGFDSRLVDLASGRLVEGADPADFAAEAAARDPEMGVAIPPEADIAGLGRRAALAPVHLLRDGDEVRLLVLPVTGRGYQSTIRALLALEGDLSTVAALIVTEQGETPGLGARIASPDWESLWPGKRVTTPTGEVAIRVVRAAQGPHEVDGITGATRTGSGVEAMLRFWLGPWGYGPFLDRLAGEGLP